MCFNFVLGTGSPDALINFLSLFLLYMTKQISNYSAVYVYTETEMLFWWHFHHWLHWKLSFWQLPVQPVMKILSKWHFRFSVCYWILITQSLTCSYCSTMKWQNQLFFVPMISYVYILSREWRAPGNLSHLLCVVTNESHADSHDISIKLNSEVWLIWTELLIEMNHLQVSKAIFSVINGWPSTISMG